MGDALRALVTEIDNARLRGLASTPFGRTHDGRMRLLLEKLNRCRIVPVESMPASVVTMSSRIACWDDAGKAQEFALVYPWNASHEGRRVSVMSALGLQLLGATLGYVFRTEGSSYSIAYVTHQPDTERQFHL